MVGRFIPISSCGACMPAMGKPLGSCQYFRYVASSLESMDVIATGDSAIRQCVCVMLEMAPHRRRRCFIPYGRWVYRTASPMADSVTVVHARYAFGQREAVRAVPR